jgi:cobalt-zinc-cadmium efflux system protein
MTDHAHAHVDHHHGHDHDHGHGGGHHGAHHHHHGRDASERRLTWALVILFAFTLVEGIGGLWANSIALLAEATHMLADSASLVLAIVAIRVGRKPASAERTYGNRRYQTLAAYTNGLLLLGLTVWVIAESVGRLMEPPKVDGLLMLGIAIVGAVANVAAFMVLSGATSLNERGARAHILSDLLGSGAAIAAAGIILTLGWLPADPLLSIAVSILILRSGWQLTRDSAHVLLEGTPGNFNGSEVARVLEEIPGVVSVHHLHAWSMTGESALVTFHARLSEGAESQVALGAIHACLRERFGIAHATVQIELAECVETSAPGDCHQ